MKQRLLLLLPQPLPPSDLKQLLLQLMTKQRLKQLLLDLELIQEFNVMQQQNVN